MSSLRVENETVVLHYISYGMRIAVVKGAISQVYDDGAEKIHKHECSNPGVFVEEAKCDVL